MLVVDAYVGYFSKKAKDDCNPGKAIKEKMAVINIMEIGPCTGGSDMIEHNQWRRDNGPRL